jgi:L-asparaginase
VTAPARIVVISTGGTIEKTYDPRAGDLSNRGSVLDHMLESLRLPDLEIVRVSLMDKDSLDMTAADHEAIASAAVHRSAEAGIDGVVVVHGTDRLTESGDATAARGPVATPIVFTGAMRPYELRDSDALQNLTEAIFAARVASPGVYVAMQGKLLEFPGITKDIDTSTFRQQT